jgi:gamma-aminobutyric acid receptor subunit beta
MRDIRYFWRDGLNSVGMSSEVELPQFRVLGHRQRATEINLTTGTQNHIEKKFEKLHKKCFSLQNYC